MLIGMDSAALAAAVPYPGKATLISTKGQINTEKNIKEYILVCMLSMMFLWAVYKSWTQA